MNYNIALNIMLIILNYIIEDSRTFNYKNRINHISLEDQLIEIQNTADQIKGNLNSNLYGVQTSNTIKNL